MTDIEKQKIKHLRSIGKSYKDISIAMNLKESTVKTYCNRNGLTDKDISLMFSETKNKCLYCGVKINQKQKQKPKKFCSDKCRMSWWKTHYSELNRKAMYSFKCGNCGIEFQAYGNNHRKYCCRRCYVISRFGGKTNEI